LKVDYLLEGSVRKADNRVRINAQLIDTSNNEKAKEFFKKALEFHVT
jgi:TolB-like protein